MNALDPPHWTLTHVSVCFVPFWFIWDHLVALPISEQNEVASEFFTTNAPDQPHWTLKSCFVTFPTIWVHSGPFVCLTILGAKRDEQVKKFVPRNRVGIFRNKRTWSTPLDPKLMFCCVSYHLGAFGTVWLPYKTGAKRAELVQKFVPWSRVGVFDDEHTRSTLLDPKLSFFCIWDRLVALRNSVKNGPN